MKTSQTHMDYLILNVIIIMLLIPLIYSISNIAPSTASLQTSELISLKEDIETIYTLGSGNRRISALQNFAFLSNVRIEQGPDTRFLLATIGDEEIIVEIPHLLAAESLPKEKGRHFLRLEYTNSGVAIIKCGDNVAAGSEQCDGTDNQRCIKPPLKECVEPGKLGECNCKCNNDEDCPPGTGICINPPDGFCAPCQSSAQCSPPNICVAGDCIPPPGCEGTAEQCADNKDNDCDGFIDCEDELDCATAPPCQPQGVCGDNVIQPPEICDGFALGPCPQTIGTVEVGCDMDPTIVDFEICTCREVCGDSIVQNPDDQNINEQCDLTNLNNQTCSSFLGPTVSRGGNLTCKAPETPGQCSFDISGCSICGDGWVREGEECEDPNSVYINQTNPGPGNDDKCPGRCNPPLSADSCQCKKAGTMK